MTVLLTPNEAQRGELRKIQAHAFATSVDDATRWHAEAGHEGLRVLVDDGGEVVAGLASLSLTQSFGGRMVSTVGIAGVGVRADRRRRGLAGALMRHTLREAKESGHPLSLLYASNQPLYRGVGYEQAGARYLGEVAPHALHGGESGDVHPSTEADWPEVDALYAELALHQPGAVGRNRYIWRRIREHRYGCEAYGGLIRDGSGRLEGWVYYRIRPGSPFYTIEVTDAAARTAAGWTRVLGHLVNLSTMAKVIQIPTAPGDPLWLQQPHPRIAMRLHEAWMLRVTDPVAALQARGWATGRSGEVALLVRDPDLGDRSLTLTVADGEAHVGGPGARPVELHVRGLAALYSGHLSARQLTAMGLLAGRPAQLDELDALFSGPAPWMREMF